MNCESARILMAARRELPYAQERALQAHLATCANCRSAWWREERALQVLRRTPAPAQSLAPVAAAAIRSRLAHPRPLRPLFVGGALVLLILLAILVAPSLVREIIRPAGAPPQATGGGGTPPPGTLYIASTLPDPNGQHIISARLTALDLSTSRERYRVEGADEALLAPDGRWLYVAGALPDDPAAGDAIRALDANSGEELWRLPITKRAQFPGQQNLLRSPDGRWLYVRSYDVSQGTGDAASVPFWLQVIDARSGQLRPETITLPGIATCGAPTLISPPAGSAVYLSCYWGTILALNTNTQQIEALLASEIVGTVLAPDPQRLWVAFARTWVSSDGPADRPVLNELDPNNQQLRRSLELQPEPAFPLTAQPLTWVGGGNWLVAGRVIEGIPGTATATELYVFNTASGRQGAHFRYDQPLSSLTVDLTGQTFYGAVNTPSSTDTTIVGLSLPDGAVQTAISRKGEQVTQLLVGP